MYNQMAMRSGGSARTLTISEARNNLTRLPARFAREPGAIEVTLRGRPVMAVLPWELYDSLMETMEILSDEEALRALKQSVKDIAAGRTYSSREVAKKLGL